MPEIIKSILFDQEEILSWIMRLYCPNGFELDPTYSKGNFYKGCVPEPKLKFDLVAQSKGVVKANCIALPLRSRTIGSIMFDPPFIAGIGKDGKPGIMKTRFGSYKTVQNELWTMYLQALIEFYRVLKDDGVLVFKCQDTIDSSKQCLSHVEIINYAVNLGFYPKDLFVLLAKNRVIGITHHVQQHARKFHSYFLVFTKRPSLTRYFGL